ncbi:MAG: hypothetical protein M1825_005892 [Sarcosagium campestre]|nr:MAG: hypothetical protein M1825_005892 [Sarcosagium campestre]
MESMLRSAAVSRTSSSTRASNDSASDKWDFEDNYQEREDYETKTGKRQRFRDAKQRAKKFLKPSHHKRSSLQDDYHDAENREPAHRVRQDPAFNPNMLRAKKSYPTAARLAEVASNAAHNTGQMISNPKSAIKGSATRTTAAHLSKVQQPYLSKGSDFTFLKAQDDLHKAEHTSATSSNGEDMSLDSKRDALERLESHRESLRTAWITGRHVRRVRVVPKQHLDFPARKQFEVLDSKSTIGKYHWLDWLGHLLLYYTQDFSSQYIDDFEELPFDVRQMRSHLERLVMASEPWQAWLMHVRRVYRWEDPVETGRWLALYLVLWYTQYIVAFVYGYIIYMVVRNHYHPSTVKRLEQSIERAADRSATAHRFGEMIDRHGRAEWLGPVIDGLGPSAQLQIGDVANMLEVLSNFYSWKSPRKTVSSLMFLLSCLTVCLVADMAFCVKIIWFIVGGAFFLCWPIASHYPRYRYLVSPIKWVLWDIPTHAEWAFQYLRREAQAEREIMIERKVEEHLSRPPAGSILDSYAGSMSVPGDDLHDKPTTDFAGEVDAESGEDWKSVDSLHSILDQSDVVALRCDCNGTLGRLHVCSSGVYFVRSVGKTELWRRSFLELTEMNKIQADIEGWQLDGSALSKMASLQKLELHFIDGRAVTLSKMKDRDAAFNTIIAFSALQWQSLQTLPGTEQRVTK